jgi:hypothetical protein
MLSTVVMISVLAMQATLGVAAPEPIDVQGPALALDPSKIPQFPNSTQPKNPAKSSKSTEPEKTTSQPKDQSAKPQKDSQPQKQGSLEKETAKAEKKQESKKNSPKKESVVETVGEALAPGIMKLLQDEMIDGFKRRGTTDRFARFQHYAIGQVRQSSSKYNGSELTGNCRLKWYEHLMRNFLNAPLEAEQFTRELHRAACDPNEGLAKVLAIAAVKMDVSPRTLRKVDPPTSPEQALDRIEQALTAAQTSYCAALAPLNKSEIRELQMNLVPVMSTNNQVGHTLMDRGTGRRLCDLMEKMDRDSLHAAADSLAPIADVRFLEQLKSLPADGDVKVAGVTGKVVSRIDTPSGAIIIGGKGQNTYQLDQMRDVACVIDLGGGNTYYEGSVGLDRPVLVVIDLGGNNTFSGKNPGIQGGAVLGVSMLLVVGDNNTYDAQDIAQGSALAGVGIQIDYGGNNRYRGIRRLQGQALCGIGVLIGRGGHNDYRAALWAQGMGGPLGFGLLDNVKGNNHYYCGGMWRNSYYPETPGYEGWGQGVGAGLRQVSSGGIGVILDGGGENTYEFDYLAHGGGYWCGLGFARDFGGNTKRLITQRDYYGRPRAYQSYQRFGCGWGCHYTMGFLFDDSGDDVYEGTIMGSGMAWDCSMGVLCDFGGNDRYRATGGTVQGNGAQMGFGVLFDYNGDDVYEGYTQAYASPATSYHHMPECGGNFSFVVDYGGKDRYGCGAENNCYIQRGDSGGFLIDRPRQDEIGHTATAAKSQR